VLLETTRDDATAQLLTKGRVAVGIHGDGQLLARVTSTDGSTQGDDVSSTLDPNAEQVLSIGPLDRPRDGGVVLLTLPRGTTRLCGVT
jgi:hypothetical protein